MANKTVDWEGIKPLYLAGELSVKAIARQFAVSDAAILKHADKHGWGERPKKVSAAPRKPAVSAAANPILQTIANQSGDLTEKQEAFCLAYMANGGDASKAYRASYDASGMTDKTTWECASRLMADHKVSTRIADLRGAAAKVAIVEQAQVLREAARLGLSDAGALFDENGDLRPIKDLPPEVRACIASVEIDDRIEGSGDSARAYRVKKVKLWDKNSALEKLMKHLGMYEADNKQRAGLFDKVPLETMKAIEDRLRALQRPGLAGQPTASSASRFTH